jgi:hypothetical protein
MATLQTRVSVPGRVLFRDLGGEAVLLAMDDGMYYGLNESGTRMWHLLAEHGHADVAYQSLLAEYDAPAERLQADLLGFLDALSSRGLVQLDET